MHSWRKRGHGTTASSGLGWSHKHAVCLLCLQASITKHSRCADELWSLITVCLLYCDDRAAQILEGLSYCEKIIHVIFVFAIVHFILHALKHATPLDLEPG